MSGLGVLKKCSRGSALFKISFKLRKKGRTDYLNNLQPFARLFAPLKAFNLDNVCLDKQLCDLHGKLNRRAPNFSPYLENIANFS